jgi:hypothetical protein
MSSGQPVLFEDGLKGWNGGVVYFDARCISFDVYGCLQEG